VRLTDFWERMDEVFGPVYARSWASDVVLPALDSGTDTRDVWRAVCLAHPVPSTLT
jgi:hypothetical protein